MLIFIQILRLKYSSLMSKIIIYLNRKEKKVGKYLLDIHEIEAI